MRSSRNDRFITLIQSALETTIKPELSSDVARQTADIIGLCLNELKRREHGTAEVLTAANREAASIAAEMKALLTQRGAPEVRPAGQSAARSDATIVDRLITENEQLTAELTGLAAALQKTARDDTMMALLLRAAQWEVRLHCEQLPTAEAGDAADVPYQPPGDEAIRDAIEAFVRTQHEDGNRVAITSFTRVTGGFSKTSYLMTLRNASGAEEQLVVRKMGHVPLIAFEATLIEEEFSLLSAVSKTDFPAPKPLWLGVDVPGTDSNFYVMTRLPGKTIGTFLGGAEKLPARYLLDLAETLAKLHNYPLETFSSYIDECGGHDVLTDSVEGWYRRRIEEWRKYAMERDVGHHLPSPMLTYLMSWLEANVPQDARRPVLLHGDFNIHNVLCVDGRVTAILDWENSMFGAPEQDLAYLRPNIEKHIDWNRFVQHYLDSGGRPLNADAFDFYLAFNAMRITFGSNRAVKNLQTGSMNDIRLAMIEFGFLPDFMRVSLERADAYTRMMGGRHDQCA